MWWWRCACDVVRAMVEKMVDVRRGLLVLKLRGGFGQPYWLARMEDQTVGKAKKSGEGRRERQKERERETMRK